MRKFGIYYAYWSLDWEADFHPFIDKVADLGFDILEVNAGSITSLKPPQRCALKDHAADKNIVLTYCIGLPRKYDIASPEQEIRNNGIAYLQEMVQAIGEMGGGVLGGILYGSWPASFPEGGSEKHAFVERSINSVKKVIPVAEDNHVVLNMEVVNRFEQFIMNTCEEALEYVCAVDSPNVKIMLDTFHMNIEEDFIGEAIQKAGEYLGHFHIGENNRKPPGYGHIPWTEVGIALRNIDYRGSIVMEPFLIPGGEVGRDIKVFRDLQAGQDLDEEARKALNFIRGVIG